MKELQLKIQEEERKEKETLIRLSKVSIDKNDIKQLQHEFNLKAKAAERILRENEGNYRKSCISLITSV